MSDSARISRGVCKDRLKDKVVLITGAGGGQGQYIALLFAEAGAKVFASDVDAATLEATGRLAAEKGLSITTTVVDAASEDQTRVWASEALAKEGRIDVLYNNGAH